MILTAVVGVSANSFSKITYTYMISQLSGSEVLLVSGIIGGISGIFFSAKNKSRWIGFGLGFVGGIVITYIMIMLATQFYMAYPFYSILGSWLFNFVFKKISK